jgi:hypothetical protein
MAKPTTLSAKSSGVTQMRGFRDVGATVGGLAGGVASSPGMGGDDRSGVAGSAIRVWERSAFFPGVGSVNSLWPRS